MSLTRIIRSIGVLVIVVVVVGAALWWWSKWEPAIDIGLRGAASSITATENISRDVLVADLTRFIMESRNVDGMFATSYRCDAGSCATVSHSQAAGHLLSGLMAAAEVSADESLRLAANEAAAAALAGCVQVPQRGCVTALGALVKQYEITGDGAYKTAAETYGVAMLNAITVPPASLDATVFSQLEPLYRLTEDDRYRDLLVAAADAKVTAWGTTTMTPAEKIRLSGQLLMPAYEVTSNTKYLQPVATFFQNYNVEASVSDFLRGDGFQLLMQSTESLLALSQSTDVSAAEQALFGAKAEKIIEDMVGWSYDAASRRTADGGGGVVTDGPAFRDPGSVQYKDLNMNGWLLEMLTRQDFMDISFALYQTE